MQVVWAHFKISRAFYQDSPTGHSTEQEKERQAEKEMEENISEWTGLKLSGALRESENRKR